MFKITGKAGFHIGFENGYTVSVQFGRGNYCTNKNVSEDYVPLGGWSCENAEVAVFGKDGEFVKLDNGDVVEAHQSVAQVLELMNKISKLP